MIQVIYLQSRISEITGPREENGAPDYPTVVRRHIYRYICGHFAKFSKFLKTIYMPGHH